MTEVEYNGCSDKETKMKIKVFTGLLDKLYHLGVQSKWWDSLFLFTVFVFKITMYSKSSIVQDVVKAKS